MWESTEDHVRWVMEWEEPGNISLTHLLEVAKSLQLFINQGHYHPVASLVKGELQRKRTKGKRPSGGKALREQYTDRPSRKHPHLLTDLQILA